jgi:hypothetical protein
MVMAIGIWALVVIVGAMAIAAALGFWHDRTHGPRPAHFLAMTEAEHVRALNMSSYYTSVHGTEW